MTYRELEDLNENCEDWAVWEWNSNVNSQKSYIAKQYTNSYDRAKALRDSIILKGGRYKVRIRGYGKWTDEKKISYLCKHGLSEDEAIRIVHNKHAWGFSMPLELADYFSVYLYENKENI